MAKKTVKTAVKKTAVKKTAVKKTAAKVAKAPNFDREIKAIGAASAKLATAIEKLMAKISK
jgi:hypothetical protein